MSDSDKAHYWRPEDEDLPAMRHAGQQSAARDETRGPSSLLRHRTLTLDRRRRRARLSGDPIPLSTIEFLILQLLADRPYWPFAYHEIVASVSTDRDPLSTDTLPDHVATLRDKLGAFADYIQSVPGFGYRFKE